MRQGVEYVNAACLILYCNSFPGVDSIGRNIFLLQILIRVFYQDCSAECCRILLYALTGNRKHSRFILVNKIQVQCEEQQVECKEIGDFTDTTFHDTGFTGFYNIGSSSVSATKVESDKQTSNKEVVVIV